MVVSTDIVNAVIYARYSSHGQTEQSIEGQLEDCYDYAKRCGFNIVGEYIDRALSGRYDNRAEFLRMISDSKRKHFQFVIVWKLDRFARNRYDSATYKYKLKQNGVRVLSAKEQISENPEGVILEALLEANAEYYSLNLAQNVKRGQKLSVEKGTFIGGHTLFGYKVVDKKVLIDERAAAIVRFVFESYDKGMPKKDIIADLNARGCLNFSGKPFTLKSFQHFLSNRKYTGKFIYGGKYECDNMYPPIIEQDLFDRVQERLAANKHAAGGRATARIKYLLQGKAWCGHCGSPLVADGGTGKLGRKYHYYACAVKKKSHLCDKSNEKKDFLEWWVVEQTIKYVLQPKRMEYIARRVVEEYEKEYNTSAVKEIEGRIAAIERQINKAVDAMIEATSSTARKAIDAKIAELEVIRDGLNLDLAKTKIAAKVRYTKEDIIAFIKRYTVGDLMDEVFREQVIDTFVNAIYLYDDKLVMYFNVHGGKQISYMGMQENTADLSDGDIMPDDLSECSNAGTLAPPESHKKATFSQKTRLFVIIKQF